MLSTQLRVAPSPALLVRNVAARKTSLVRSSRLTKIVVKASEEQQVEKTFTERLALPAAALLGAALLFAGTPDEALAARSGGRVGGSGGFAARRSAPPPATKSAPAVTNNYYGGGFGMPFFPGFGMPVFGGWGFGFGMPIFGFGALFNFMLLSLLISVVWAAVSNFSNPTRKNDKDDEW